MATLLALPKPPDAVFCFNDLLALGALRAAHYAHGYRVPDVIALVGFDDIEDSRYSTPSLTTVRPDKQQIATRAVDLLTRRIAGETYPPVEESASLFLAVRESTGL
jgi:DNA-binding LacI/PurR family transcriptional regulator